ncbi:MAG TPA: 3-methyl-2-oxobutanoate hydroxymethyltransferase, partial [Zoogloea sp.]|nr:3-methyl-2-oxobutanoate hydroxymethyltransferase [Zoogloea sp.]
MSYLQESNKPVTLFELGKMRAEGRKIVMLTGYDASFAALLERCGVDVILVGDSLGNVLQGQKTTLPVSMEHMVYHTECVARGSSRPLIVADMPFGSYAESPAQARQKLRDQDLFPTDIAESANVVAARGGKDSAGQRGGGGRVSARDLAMLTRQFAVLLKAGMPLVDALGAMQEQTSKPRLQAALYDIRDNVNSGMTLGDALAKHP